MKSVFTITADTDRMTVKVAVHQGGKLMHSSLYPTVSEALLALLQGIGTVMAKHNEEAES